MEVKNHKSYLYSSDVVNNKIIAPKYVKKQCKLFLDIADEKNKKYYINKEQIEVIEGLLQYMIMPVGVRAGLTIYDSLSGYQWLFLISIFCVVHRNKPNRRRYAVGLLEIARRQGKTLIIGITFIILLLTLPKFSKVYSVAPISRQSKEVREAITQIINCSPYLLDKFKIRRDYIQCLLNENTYYTLTEKGNEDKFDSCTVSMYLADEVANLRLSKTLEGLKSGTLTVDNPLSFIISTKYDKFDNPFEEELKYAKSVLDGDIEDDKIFSLIYEPDEPDSWMSNSNVLLQTNPLCYELPEMLDKLLEKRKEAIDKPSSKPNFLTKHCNIICSDEIIEEYISHNDLIKCRSEKPINWTGRQVFLAMDLSISDDNTAIAMVSDDDGTILAQSMCFIPEGQIDVKNKREHLNYHDFINKKECIACGDRIIDYSVIENYIISIEKKFGVKVMGVGFDRYNAMSSAQKIESAGYEVVEIKQHSSVLHTATKLLKESILNGQFQYDENTLLDVNFQNARCTEDTNLNKYVNKKKSNGKVDMVVSLINAVYLLEQNRLNNKHMQFVVYR